MTADGHRARRIVRVLPDVTGLDKTFDYTVEVDDDPRVGWRVRIDLHGRRVGGWVVAVDPADGPPVETLKPIAKVSGLGPDAEMIALAEWAAMRWVARRRHFLTAASPPRTVTSLGAADVTAAVVEPRSPASSELLAHGGGVLRLPPTADPMPAVQSAASIGPTLVVVPAVDHARLLAGRLRRSGRTVALMPDQWSAAASGVDVVVGARNAAWAPCRDLAVVVLVDEHDEGVYAESSPTWNARDVLLERCRRADVPLLMVSPCPTLHAIEWRPVVRPPAARERAGWPIVDVIDRSDTEPWKRSLVTSELIGHLRDPERTVVCVSNTTGRARVLACRSCRELVRCERCDAAVALTDDGRLRCARCDLQRPPVCANCGSSDFANLRPGVTRLREELEAAAGRAVARVTGADDDVVPDVGVYVGTEAVLHRVATADTVAFLDIDRELLAPRYRADEQAMALLVRAARLVGPRARGGRLLLQTFMPRHRVIQAALMADPGRLVDGERERRSMLGLPPFGSIAELSGPGAADFVGSLPPDDAVLCAHVGDGRWLVRADDPPTLSRHLAAGVRPPGQRLRIAVDPAR